MLPVLHTLTLSHNKLETVDDIIHLTQCPELSVVDLSHNNLQNQQVIQVFKPQRTTCPVILCELFQ